MLSKHSTKLLKWLAKQDRWLTKAEMQNECKYFDDHSFRAIHEEKYLLLRRAGDRAQLIQYRISESGRAYLQERNSQKAPEIRGWITAILSILSFISGLLLSEPFKYLLGWITGS